MTHYHWTFFIKIYIFFLKIHKLKLVKVFLKLILKDDSYTNAYEIATEICYNNLTYNTKLLTHCLYDN